jgi:hypothetical protein
LGGNGGEETKEMDEEGKRREKEKRVKKER